MTMPYCVHASCTLDATEMSPSPKLSCIRLCRALLEGMHNFIISYLKYSFINLGVNLIGLEASDVQTAIQDRKLLKGHGNWRTPLDTSISI